MSTIAAQPPVDRATVHSGYAFLQAPENNFWDFYRADILDIQSLSSALAREGSYSAGARLKILAAGVNFYAGSVILKPIGLQAASAVRVVYLLLTAQFTDAKHQIKFVAINIFYNLKNVIVVPFIVLRAAVLPQDAYKQLSQTYETELSQGLQGARERFTALQEEHQTAISTLQAQLIAATTGNETEVRTRVTEQTVHTIPNVDITLWQGRVDTLQEEVDALRGELGTAEGELHTVHGDLSQATQHLRENVDAIDALTTENERLQEEHSQLLARLQQRSVQVTVTEQQLVIGDQVDASQGSQVPLHAPTPLLVEDQHEGQEHQTPPVLGGQPSSLLPIQPVMSSPAAAPFSGSTEHLHVS